MFSIPIELLPYVIVSFLIALSVHESAHALAAKWLGDPTAERLGRITLNPLPHLDFAGTLILFFAGFGWGKPVPIDERYFKNKKRDNALVAFAGPASNILLAFIGMVFLKYFTYNTISFEFFRIFTSLNLVLAVFNMIPVPPLDGSHILELFIPKSMQMYWLEFQETAPFLLLGVLLFEHFFNVPVLSSFVFMITDVLFSFIKSIT